MIFIAECKPVPEKLEEKRCEMRAFNLNSTVVSLTVLNGFSSLPMKNRIVQKGCKIFTVAYLSEEKW